MCVDAFARTQSQDKRSTRRRIAQLHAVCSGTCTDQLFQQAGLWCSFAWTGGLWAMRRTSIRTLGKPQPSYRDLLGTDDDMDAGSEDESDDEVSGGASGRSSPQQGTAGAGPASAGKTMPKKPGNKRPAKKSTKKPSKSKKRKSNRGRTRAPVKSACLNCRRSKVWSTERARTCAS